MSTEQDSSSQIENNTTVDKEGNITVDFTNELLPMTANSKIIVKIGLLSYVMRPIRASEYYKYGEMLDGANEDKIKERKAREWLVTACMVEGGGTIKYSEEVIGLYFVLFNVLMNKSFLLKND